MHWETEFAELLAELTAIQDQLLDVLQKKRQSMADNDAAAMAALQPQEETLAQRLADCHQRRARLLEHASNEGLPGESLESLAVAADSGKRETLRRQVKQSSARMRLLQHESLTNWVLAQRTLIHLSQMLEIIATGGRLKPTYTESDFASSGGALVDREV